MIDRQPLKRSLIHRQRSLARQMMGIHYGTENPLRIKGSAMLSHQLGLVSSWKMLTRDKGWIKPLLVIALFSWIPVVGPIIVLGYGLEWARLTAWGVDAAPKQHGVDFGKMFKTGAIAFLYTLAVGLVCAIVGFFLFKGMFWQVFNNSGLRDSLTEGALSAIAAAVLDGGNLLVPFIISFIVMLFVETIVLAMQLRATLYDGFGAGWRLDRVFQMMLRDAGGFVHVAAVYALWSVVGALFDKIVSLCQSFGFMALSMMGMSMSRYGTGVVSIARAGVVPMLLLAAVAILVLFAFQVIKVALQLIAINVMGQWFQRFDVGRWGVSAAPLPVDAPRRKGWSGAARPAETPRDAQPEPAPADAQEGSDAASGASNDAGAAAEAEREPVAEVRSEPILLGPITTSDEPEDDQEEQ